MSARDPSLPFFTYLIVKQLSAWPAGDTGIIATMRVAMEGALELPQVTG